MGRELKSNIAAGVGTRTYSNSLPRGEEMEVEWEDVGDMMGPADLLLETFLLQM